MLVFWRQRLVVLATPKTGSTSLEAALGSMADLAVLRPPGLRHTSAPAFRTGLAPYLEAEAGEPFRVAALMREPLDWLASWYRARRRELAEADLHEDHLFGSEGRSGMEGKGLPARPFPGAVEGSDGDRAKAGTLSSFDAFVRANLDGDPGGPADVGSQFAFLTDSEGRLAVDRLFRYDRFDEFTTFLEAELDCDLELPRLNSSPARDLTLPEATQEDLQVRRAQDFALFASL
jgi:hypothetical protein